MRVMMANMIPWAQFRRTYGAAIVSRELVQRRIGRLAALMTGCDAMVAWCSWLLDQGFRGEMECIIAKIFGSEAQKEAAIELFMKTHGGRAFLRGHVFGENIHEYLAPCIYEGEGEMLGMAFFKSLIKEHGKTYFEPIGKALQAAGIKKPNMMNPAHAWALRSALIPYAKWRVGEALTPRDRPAFPGVPPRLAAHAEFAAAGLQRSRLEISDVMTKHQLRLADRQCRMAELSQRVQDLVVILATSLWAGRQSERDRPERGRYPLPGPEAEADRKPAHRRLLSRGHQAGRDHRRRGLRGHRRCRGRADPDAVQGVSQVPLPPVGEGGPKGPMGDSE